MRVNDNNGIIFITGGTGFIGSHIVEELIMKGYRLRCLVRKKESAAKILCLLRNIPYSEKYIEFVYGDITQKLTKHYFRDVTIVLHLAAAIETGYYQNYDVLYKTNVLGTRNVVEAILAGGETIENFIHFSSMAAIGIRDLDTLVTEDIECKPDTPYGKTKYESELLLRRYWEENKLPVTILRLPTVYGPREQYNFRKLVKAIKNKRFAFIGDGENLTSVLYVKNLSHEIDKFFVKGRGEIYHLADPEPISWKKLVEYISEVLGIQPPSLHIPVSLAKVAALAFEVITKLTHIEPPLHRGRVKTLTSNFAFSIEKAVKEIGYSPPYPTQIAIKETILSISNEI